MKLYDPIPLIKPDRPGTLARVVSYDLDAKIAQVEFLGKTYSAKSAGENRLEPGEMVNFVGLPEPWAIKTEAGLPTRFDDLLFKVFKTHPACGFLRFCLRNRPKIKKYAVGLSQGPSGDFTLNVACYDGITRSLPVVWAGEPKSADAFPAGTTVLTCQVTENNWIVVGKALGRILFDPETLSFPETQIGEASAVQTCTVTTIDVDADVSLTCTDNFQIRISEDDPWGFSAILPKEGGIVQVRFWPNFPEGNQAGTVAASAIEAEPATLDLNGIAVKGTLEAFARVIFNLPQFTYVSGAAFTSVVDDPESEYFGYTVIWNLQKNDGFAEMSATDPGSFPVIGPGGYFYSRNDFDPGSVGPPAIFGQRNTGVVDVKFPIGPSTHVLSVNAERFLTVDTYQGEPVDWITPVGGLAGAVEIKGHNYKLTAGFFPADPPEGESQEETIIVENGAKAKIEINSTEPGIKGFYFNAQPHFS